MSTFRERYGNGPTSWPLWVRVVATVVLLWVPVTELVAVLFADGDPHAAGWLMVAGITGMLAWAVLRWLWQPTDRSRLEDWQVERSLREGIERDAKAEDGPAESLHDREIPPSRW